MNPQLQVSPPGARFAKALLTHRLQMMHEWHLQIADKSRDSASVVFHLIS